MQGTGTSSEVAFQSNATHSLSADKKERQLNPPSLDALVSPLSFHSLQFILVKSLLSLFLLNLLYYFIFMYITYFNTKCNWFGIVSSLCQYKLIQQQYHNIVIFCVQGTDTEIGGSNSKTSGYFLSLENETALQTTSQGTLTLVSPLPCSTLSSHHSLFLSLLNIHNLTKILFQEPDCTVIADPHVEGHPWVMDHLMAGDRLRKEVLKILL